MAVEVIEVVQRYNSGTASITWSFDATPELGELLLGVVRNSSLGIGTSLPEGFNLLEPHTNINEVGLSIPSLGIIWKVATDNEIGSYSLTSVGGHSSEKGGALYRLRGVDLSAPFGVIESHTQRYPTFPFRVVANPVDIASGSLALAVIRHVGTSALADNSTFTEGFDFEGHTWRIVTGHKEIGESGQVFPEWSSSAAYSSWLAGTIIEIRAEGSAAPAVVFSDSFIAPDGTELSEHAPKLGAGWLKTPAHEVDWLISGAALANIGVGHYVADIAGLGSNYSVAAELRHSSSQTTTRNAICARKSKTSDTMYYASYVMGATLEWRLVKRVNGVETVLGSYSESLSSSVYRGLRLEVTDEYKKVFLGGNEIISSDDNEIEDGYPGLWGYGQSFSASLIDNFIVWGAGSSEPPLPPAKRKSALFKGCNF